METLNLITPLSSSNPLSCHPTRSLCHLRLHLLSSSAQSGDPLNISQSLNNSNINNVGTGGFPDFAENDNTALTSSSEDDSTSSCHPLSHIVILSPTLSSSAESGDPLIFACYLDYYLLITAYYPVDSQQL